MPFDRAARSALECDDVSIDVRPEKADWFVPNAAGREVLERLSGGEARLSLPDRTFLDRLADLRRREWPFNVSMCVVADVPAVVDLAAERGAADVHFMWYFVRGRGERSAWAQPGEIFLHLAEAAERAKRAGVGLEAAWRDCPTWQPIRQGTAADEDESLRFLLGGGDFDHSYLASGRPIGADPYWPLHERTALLPLPSRRGRTGLGDLSAGTRAAVGDPAGPDGRRVAAVGRGGRPCLRT